MLTTDKVAQKRGASPRETRSASAKKKKRDYKLSSEKAELEITVDRLKVVELELNHKILDKEQECDALKNLLQALQTERDSSMTKCSEIYFKVDE